MKRITTSQARLTQVCVWSLMCQLGISRMEFLLGKIDREMLRQHVNKLQGSGLRFKNRWDRKSNGWKARSPTSSCDAPHNVSSIAMSKGTRTPAAKPRSALDEAAGALPANVTLPPIDAEPEEIAQALFQRPPRKKPKADESGDS